MDSKDNYMSSKNKMIFLVIYFCALICIPFFIDLIGGNLLISPRKCL